jgi:enoyl-CoA hydratase
METCQVILDKITSKPPMAVGLIIDCVNASYTKGEDGYQTEANSFGMCTKTQDFKEGTAAFLEKRKPEFTGK